MFELLTQFPNIYHDLQLSWTTSDDVMKLANCSLNLKQGNQDKSGNSSNSTNHNSHQIFLYKGFDDPVIQFTDELLPLNMTIWFELNAIPVVRDINEDNIHYFNEHKKIAFIYLYSDDNIFEASNITHLNESYRPFYEIAKKHKVSLNNLIVITYKG